MSYIFKYHLKLLIQLWQIAAHIPNTAGEMKAVYHQQQAKYVHKL